MELSSGTGAAFPLTSDDPDVRSEVEVLLEVLLTIASLSYLCTVVVG